MDWKTFGTKWLKGAAIAAGGAVLTYVGAVVITDMQSGGAVTLAAILSMAINAIKLVIEKSKSSDE